MLLRSEVMLREYCLVLLRSEVMLEGRTAWCFQSLR